LTYRPTGHRRSSPRPAWVATKNQGFDAFVPLIDSGISLYVWSQPRFLSVVAFTCKRFDTERAVEFTRDFFAMSQVASQQF
jgi:S-adenosylmethionine decarboxylase